MDVRLPVTREGRVRGTDKEGPSVKRTLSAERPRADRPAAALRCLCAAFRPIAVDSRFVKIGALLLFDPTVAHRTR